MGCQQWVLQCVTVCSPDLLFDDAILSIKGARTPQQSTACPMSGRPRSFRLARAAGDARESYLRTPVVVGQFYYYAKRGIVSAIIGFLSSSLQVYDNMMGWYFGMLL